MPYRKVVCAFNSIASVRSNRIVVIADDIVRCTIAQSAVVTAFRVRSGAVTDGCVVASFNAPTGDTARSVVIITDNIVARIMPGSEVLRAFNAIARL